MEGEGLTYKGESMRFGMVTYQWGKDWQLPTLLEKCEGAKIAGVELRTTHAHGVEPELGAPARQAAGWAAAGAARTQGARAGTRRRSG